MNLAWPDQSWSGPTWPDLAYLRSGQGPTWPNGRDATGLYPPVTSSKVEYCNNWNKSYITTLKNKTPKNDWFKFTCKNRSYQHAQLYTAQQRVGNDVLYSSVLYSRQFYHWPAAVLQSDCYKMHTDLTVL